jgi:hypothetical protein
VRLQSRIRLKTISDGQRVGSSPLRFPGAASPLGRFAPGGAQAPQLRKQKATAQNAMANNPNQMATAQSRRFITTNTILNTPGAVAKNRNHKPNKSAYKTAKNTTPKPQNSIHSNKKRHIKAPSADAHETTEDIQDKTCPPTSEQE